MTWAASWSGTSEQFDRIIRNQTRNLKVVEPIKFTGYSRDHRAWVLGDMAVRDGKLIKINEESYFDLPRRGKLKSPDRLLDITYDPDQIDFDWLPDLWTAYDRAWLRPSSSSLSRSDPELPQVDRLPRNHRRSGRGQVDHGGIPLEALGRPDHEGNDPNKGTVVFLARTFMKVSNLPVGLIEGKRGDDDKRSGQRQYDYNELLVLYNGRNPRGTGQKSDGYETHEPPFLGTIYLMQNERIDAIPAVLERLMSMKVDKSRWSDATKLAAVRLERWPIERASGTIVHVVRNEAGSCPTSSNASTITMPTCPGAFRACTTPADQVPQPACRRCRRAGPDIPQLPPGMDR
jgi:hypothetical protein